MPIPTEFTNATDWNSLHVAIRGFGDSRNVGEDDLIAALQTVEDWQARFTEIFSLESRGKVITWRRYEGLIWALGESFRQIMIRNRQLRKSNRVFNSVRTICLDRGFAKGRQSFTMLLGRYGGTSQIKTLISLLDDQDVCGHAIYALRLLGAPEAAEKVRPYLKSPKTWIKKEALKYFQKIQTQN